MVPYISRNFSSRIHYSYEFSPIALEGFFFINSLSILANELRNELSLIACFAGGIHAQSS